jgi:hypothetical protein
MDRTGRCAERHNATTTGPARVERELLVEVNGTEKPRDSFIYSNPKKPGASRAFAFAVALAVYFGEAFSARLECRSIIFHSPARFTQTSVIMKSPLMSRGEPSI